MWITKYTAVWLQTCLEIKYFLTYPLWKTTKWCWKMEIYESCGWYNKLLASWILRNSIYLIWFPFHWSVLSLRNQFSCSLSSCTPLECWEGVLWEIHYSIVRILRPIVLELETCPLLFLKYLTQLFICTFSQMSFHKPPGLSTFSYSKGVKISWSSYILEVVEPELKKIIRGDIVLCLFQ